MYPKIFGKNHYITQSYKFIHKIHDFTMDLRFFSLNQLLNENVFNSCRFF